MILTPVFLAVACMASGRLDCQTAPPAPAPQTQTPTHVAPVPKPPPPPLFPRHRRGIYLNGLGKEVLDATPQSPPLLTDDPGVPDKGEYEINLSTGADATRHTKQFDLFLVDANYGLLPKVLGRHLPTQLTIELPLSAASSRTQLLTVGMGSAAAGMKFNFYNSEHHSIQMAFYPQVEFNLGARSVDHGLAEPGQTLRFPLLVSKTLKYVTVVLNGALNQPLNDPARFRTATFGAGFGLAVTRKFAAMVELHTESRLDLAHDRLLIANVGLMRSIGHAVVYGNVGRSLISDDGLRHLYAGAGVKVMIAPRTKQTR